MIKGRSVIPLAIVAVAVGIGLTRSAERGEDGQIIDAGAVDAFDMHVGDCFDDWGTEDEVLEVPGVPCADPHDNEVYATFDITGDGWPGEEEIEFEANEGCYDRFERAIGKTYKESVIDFTPIYPSSDSWKERNDREVICVAFHMEYDKLTGTVIGSGM